MMLECAAERGRVPDELPRMDEHHIVALAVEAIEAAERTVAVHADLVRQLVGAGRGRESGSGM